MFLLSSQGLPPFPVSSDKRRSISPGTLKTYASAWRGFVRFCEEQGVRALPAGASVVARYLRQRAFVGKSSSVIRVDYSAIKAAHVEARLTAQHAAGVYRVCEDPTEDEDVQATMRDLTYAVRERRRPVNRINSLTKEQLEVVRFDWTDFGGIQGVVLRPCSDPINPTRREDQGASREDRRVVDGEGFFIEGARSRPLAECRTTIDRSHALPVVRQCKLVELSRSTAY